ncbi:hypothetical protein EQM13_07355 [Acidilutibacter cellobiosedens]|uniref:RNA polymerase sigma factor 70 region 4 type 2 domain-containing protein n=1 Tax=Acidilutibacter cellobiosedens TaxID=2507161 RepID=A0A410QBM6_9FIRM|nr:sigma factor-like helix-turn-helix DNA-binding protein [Acidilutibacter cellobiosedens]MBE6083601.1 hypothetical protein [Tissierellaceae bacterium]QAT61406.1 hypothetical protein EQM13_07355 [Acidilutibacter cellobiosedens]
MNKLAEKFFYEKDENRDLYNKVITNNDRKSLPILEEKFFNYLFKIYLTSYINKSITYTALNFKKKYNLLNLRELPILNISDEDFNEEKINNIPDIPLDYVEEICNIYDNFDFRQIISDEKLLSAIDMLSNRQKKILYMYYVQEKEEWEIAVQLNITRQSVNKTRNRAISRIKFQLGRD